jgi:hypothetical protein
MTFHVVQLGSCVYKTLPCSLKHFCFEVHLLNNMINVIKYENFVHLCSLVQLCAFVTRGWCSSGPGLTGDDNLEGVEGGVFIF